MIAIQELDFSPLWLSFRTGTAAAILSLIPGIWLAWKSMKMKPFGRSVLDGFLTLPLLLPPTAVGALILCLSGIRMEQNRLLWTIQPEVSGKWGYSFLAGTIIAFPLLYRTVRHSFEQIPESLIHVGKTLGMSGIQLFWKVIFPSAKKGIVTGFVWTLLRAMGEYGATAMLVQNTIGKRPNLSFAIADNLTQGSKENALFWSLGITVFVFLILLILNILTGSRKKTGRWN